MTQKNTATNAKFATPYEKAATGFINTSQAWLKPEASQQPKDCGQMSKIKPKEATRARMVRGSDGEQYTTILGCDQLGICQSRQPSCTACSD